MEKVHRQDNTNELFIDKPPPGRGYLLLLYLTLAISLFTMVSVGYLVVASGEANTIFWIIMVLSMVFLVLVFGFILHGAYSTVYIIEGGVLKMRSGPIKGSVELATVRGISKNGSVTTTVGWGIGSRAICNRFSDIVVIQSGREKICISPTDPNLFIEQLRSLIPNPIPEKTPGTGDSP
jgi:Bacterial PH domain